MKSQAKQRVGQGQVGVDAGGGQRVAVQVDTAFEIAALGDAPIAGDGVMADGGEEEQVAVPVVQPLAKLAPGAVQGVEQHGFHQTRFVDRAARMCSTGGSPTRSSSGRLRAG